MALCDALIEHQVGWDEAAAVGEYRVLGKCVESAEVTAKGVEHHTVGHLRHVG
jgi:hypothetical protein